MRQKRTSHYNAAERFGTEEEALTAAGRAHENGLGHGEVVVYHHPMVERGRQGGEWADFFIVRLNSYNTARIFYLKGTE